MEALLGQIEGHYVCVETLKPHLIPTFAPYTLRHSEQQWARFLHIEDHLFGEDVRYIAEHLGVKRLKQFEQAFDDECELSLVRWVVSYQHKFLLQQHAAEELDYVMYWYGAEESLEGEVRLKEGSLREHDVSLRRQFVSSNHYTALVVSYRFSSRTEKARKP